MATVIFDLDSTLLTIESLEHSLRAQSHNQEIIRQIEMITEQGMSGDIPFLTSLKKRLDLVKLKKEDVLIGNLSGLLTPGMLELIAELQAKGVDVWIISGALKETVAAVGHLLGIPKEHCLGIELQWDQSGYYLGIDSSTAINRSKWEAARQFASTWSRPVIAVGDGITDYALYEHGLVNRFVAYTEHKRRQVLLDKGVPEAKNVEELKKVLADGLQLSKK